MSGADFEQAMRTGVSVVHLARMAFRREHGRDPSTEEDFSWVEAYIELSPALARDKAATEAHFLRHLKGTP